MAGRAQVNALMRKHLAYQRRSIATNCFLLSAPIFFCLLLFVMQLLINNLLLTGPETKCGCRCTQCCSTDDNGVENCTASIGYCSDTCRSFDNMQCGIEFSTPQQAVRCAEPNPDSWPPLIQTPKYGWRPGPDQVRMSIPYTGKDKAMAMKIAANMFAQPDLAKTFLDACAPSLLMQTPNKSGFPTIRGETFSKLGLVLGTSEAPNVQILKEAAFLGSSPIYVSVPMDFCMKKNMTPTKNYTFPELVAALVPAGMLGAYGLNNSGGGGSSSLAMLTRLASLCQSPAAVQTLQAVTALRLKFQCVDSVMSLQETVADVDRQVYCGWFEARCDGRSRTQQYPGAFDFGQTSNTALDLTLYINSTTVAGRRGRKPHLRLHELLNQAVNSWMSTALLPGQGGKWRADLLSLQSVPKRADTLNLDFSSLLGPLFYSWVVQMLLPTFLVQLVYEKEKRLRIMMKMHGLGDGAYWLVSYLWYLTLYITYIIIFLIFGSVIGLNLFTLNSMGIQIILYLLFGNVLIAFSYLLSCFFTSSRTAVVVAFLWVFGTGLIGNLLLENFMDRDPDWMFYVEWIPAFALYRGIYELAQYAFLGAYRHSTGMQFSNLNDPKNGMIAVWGIFIVESVVFATLAWYIEQVFSTGTGLSRHPLFFLGFKRKEPAMASLNRSGAVAVDMDAPITDDVGAERKRVAEITDFTTHPIVVRGLRKVFPPQDGVPPKVAVSDLSMAVEHGECFGLLGPNGAGKTTSINMMIGFLEPTEGSAIIDGKDIRNHMAEIYQIMGVCPQHDLLWDTMTGEEHLRFYGRLKGLTGDALSQAVESALKDVNLYNQGWGKVVTRKYSGGMKRRLSVAISFMGNPRVVYLDEPSTGLDPASRRNLWEVVKHTKKKRSIILTTHSMEEAEVLCDRLGIFVDGRLACVGNPKEITSRYGGYYVFTIMVTPDEDEAARQLVERMSPGANLTYSVAGTLKFELPQSEVTLSQVFRSMQSAKQGLKILDWGIANATLEEVFIKFARQVGATMAD